MFTYPVTNQPRLPGPTRRFGKTSRAALPAALALFCLTGCLTFHNDNGTTALRDHPYPGQMVDVGGYDLYFNCTAPAPYTVLLEAGAGMPSLMWKPVQDLLAPEEGIQVCSYDRAGHGWSDPYPGPYDIDQEVEVLHTAVQKLAVERLILVGASYGGFLTHLYAAKYPDAVAGLVYGDANSVYFFDKHPEVVEDMERTRPPWYMKIAPRGLVRHFTIKAFREHTGDLAEEDLDTLVRLITSKKHRQADLKKNQAFGATVARVREVEHPKTIKTVVITRGKRETHAPWTTEQREQDWRDGQKTFLEHAQDGVLMIATESGHAVNFDQPDLIADAVVNLVNEIRNQQQEYPAVSRQATAKQ